MVEINLLYLLIGAVIVVLVSHWWGVLVYKSELKNKLWDHYHDWKDQLTLPQNRAQGARFFMDYFVDKEHLK